MSTQLVASDSRGGRRDIGRDFFSNISSDLNGIAAQTSSMFSDLFGKFEALFILAASSVHFESFSLSNMSFCSNLQAVKIVLIEIPVPTLSRRRRTGRHPYSYPSQKVTPQSTLSSN